MFEINCFTFNCVFKLRSYAKINCLKQKSFCIWQCVNKKNYTYIRLNCMRILSKWSNSALNDLLKWYAVEQSNQRIYLLLLFTSIFWVIIEIMLTYIYLSLMMPARIEHFEVLQVFELKIILVRTTWTDCSYHWVIADVQANHYPVYSTAYYTIRWNCQLHKSFQMVFWRHVVSIVALNRLIFLVFMQ